MLDRSKLIMQLRKVADDLFTDQTAVCMYAQDMWRVIIADPCFLYKVRQVTDLPWPVPLWEGDLGAIIDIEKVHYEHNVLSVDGSQIYPDRHANVACFLLNTGSVVLPYGTSSKVELYSTPTVFTGVEENGIPCTTDMVNCKRQELELQEGLALAKRIKEQYQHSDDSCVLLFDGSLIFWHLLSKEAPLRDYFLHSYCALLDQLYKEKVLSAWYISAPKSKELVNLIRLHLSDFNPANTAAYDCINTITDNAIMANFLRPSTRSIVFKNCSSVSNFYLSHTRPFFFYVHTGTEIGRVEIPAWIASNDALIDKIAQVVLDQSTKGVGYPVALAEAHEQAVIKGPDREFFYHFLQKMIMERGRAVVNSRKSIKKRGMGI